MSYYSHNSNGDWRAGTETWNMLGGFAALVLVFYFAITMFDALNANINYQIEQTFVSCDERCVVTDSNEYRLSAGTNVLVNRVSSTLENGDTIVLTVSEWNGMLVEISCNGDLVYQVKQAPMGEILSKVAIFIGLGGILAVFFYSINAKNPHFPFSLIKQIFILGKNTHTPHHSDDF